MLLHSVCRWKAVAVFDPSLPGLVVSGGDAAKNTLPHKGYLNDLWWLPTNVSLPFWYEPEASSPSQEERRDKKHKKQKHGEPQARQDEDASTTNRLPVMDVAAVRLHALTSALRMPHAEQPSSCDCPPRRTFLLTTPRAACE